MGGRQTVLLVTGPVAALSRASQIPQTGKYFQCKHRQLDRLRGPSLSRFSTCLLLAQDHKFLVCFLSDDTNTPASHQTTFWHPVLIAFGISLCSRIWLGFSVPVGGRRRCRVTLPFSDGVHVGVNDHLRKQWEVSNQWMSPSFYIFKPRAEDRTAGRNAALLDTVFVNGDEKQRCSWCSPRPYRWCNTFTSSWWTKWIWDRFNVISYKKGRAKKERRSLFGVNEIFVMG